MRAGIKGKKHRLAPSKSVGSAIAGTSRRDFLALLPWLLATPHCAASLGIRLNRH
jgi:hypothetical protein